MALLREYTSTRRRKFKMKKKINVEKRVSGADNKLRCAKIGIN